LARNDCASALRTVRSRSVSVAQRNAQPSDTDALALGPSSNRTLCTRCARSVRRPARRAQRDCSIARTNHEIRAVSRGNASWHAFCSVTLETRGITMKKLTSVLALLAAPALAACANVSARTAPATAAESNPRARDAPHIVAGDLDVSNAITLDAYANLEVVAGTLTIVGNTRLRNLDGLQRLRAVGQLVIEENLALTTIDGLSGLRHARSVTIARNPRLENLRGLEALERLERLVVTENGIFCTRGIGGLTNVGELIVARNPRLLSLRGLSQLESAESLAVVGNPRVSAQTGFFSKLRRVTGKLEIERNAGLDPSDVARLQQRIQSDVELAAR
jgi:hypothetical protein